MHTLMVVWMSKDIPTLDSFRHHLLFKVDFLSPNNLIIEGHPIEEEDGHEGIVVGILLAGDTSNLGNKH